MRFLVTRTSSFRDRQPWGEEIDVEDEVSRVHSRRTFLPESIGTRFHQLAFGLRLLWRSRRYDAIAIGRHGVWLPIFQRLLGIRKRVIMTDIEWPTGGTGLVNRAAAAGSVAICCNTTSEIESYSNCFKIPRSKFHLVLMAFQTDDIRVPSDEGYIFAGGNYGRDWTTLLQAVDGLPYPIKVFTSRTTLPFLPHNVTVSAASRTEYHDRMAAASCVVVPVIREPMRVTGPTTWINAMAMGKVVIVTHPEGARDYIEHGVTGFCVDHGDAAGLRQTIRTVMENPDLRKRVGEAARHRAYETFSPGAFRAEILRLLKDRQLS